MSQITPETIADYTKELATSDRLYVFIDTLETFINEMYSSTRSTQEVVEDFISPTSSNNILKTCVKEYGIDISNKESLITFLNDLKTSLEDIHVTKVTIALEPTLKFTKTLHTEICDLLGKNLIIELTTNPAILGGLIIIDDGNYRNMTLAKELDELLIKDKEVILKKISDNTGNK